MQREPDFDNHLMDRSFLTASIPELVDEMTLDEKRVLLSADGWWHTAPIPRLNIPSVKVTDGPGGARGGSAYSMTPAVSFPNATCLAATFSRPLARSMGEVLAADTKARGALCLLAPTINIQRSPLGGRAFESFSEDPTLSGHIAAEYVGGLQSKGVSATIKHFICNDQEHDRVGQDSIVQPRALREIYLRPFQIAQKLEGPWAVMTSYNKVNGTHVSENKPLLDILRKEWGHQGIIMSDWFGTYSISEAINAGLNIEFPGPTRFRNKTLIDHLVTAHKIDERQIDSLVTCILAWVQKLARISPEHVYAKEKAEFTRWDAKAHDAALVRKIAAEGIVVLKNEQSVLPVRKGKVAVIGPNARAKVFTGGGSARLQPAWSTTPWQGLELGKPADVDLSYALGCSTSKFFPLLDEHFTTEDGTVGFDAYHYALTEDGLQAAQHIGHDKLLRSEVRFNNWTLPDLGSSWFTELKAVFTSPLTGEYEFEIIGTGKFWFYVDDRLVQEVTDYAVKGEAFYGNGTPTKAVRVAVKKGQKYNLRVLHDTRPPPDVKYLMSAPFRYPAIRWGAQPAYEPEQAMSEAVALARQVDTVVLVCGLNQDWESEGDDRPNLSLPLRSDELIHKVVEANPNTIVVIQGGSAVSMPWLDKVKGVVQAWYGGCETGTSIADIVYGHINPSGRLPLTFPRKEEDIPAAMTYKSANTKTYYEEGIWVGYKHYNARKIDPLFPFGHGLSYTTFSYADLTITSVSPLRTAPNQWRLTVQVDVTNTGRTAGDHSVHFYVSPPPETSTGLKHPKYTLQGFTKVRDLAPGATSSASVTLDKYAISHWDEQLDVWRAEPGEWSVHVGINAQEMFGRATFQIGPGFEWTGL